jgi:phosphoribosyl 1,2-cyclic phosphate phosphodiesterase
LKLTLLGTGTSQGVPVIGCECRVCQSQHPHDNRLRSAALLQHKGINILIDPGPDFRQQMLRAKVKHLNAILITHEHNDHIIGIDDVRPFNFASGEAMKVFALPRVANDLKHRFQYVFSDPIPGLPRIELHYITPNSQLQFNDLQIQAIEILHGKLPILGFRFGNSAYLTDVKTIPTHEFSKLTDLKHLVINALHYHPHPTHLNVPECLELIKEINPENAWITHMSHHIGLAAEVSLELPKGVQLGFDGLEIEL